MGECWLCSAGYRAWAVAPNAGSAITCEAAALVWVLTNYVPDSGSPQPWQPNAASLDRSSYSTTWMVCCAACTAFTLRRRSFTLTAARLLPCMWTSVPVLRQSTLPCHLQRHGLPSTA
ncbi:hypothetical protein TcCL_NonESM09575 [Trypanosoma cruzi]|nr:hypothetical protein TcCL_NonESM09575 [Trypanosoma cruzi]